MSRSNSNLWIASSELLVATIFWGFGFVATHWMLEVLNPVEIGLLRFGAAALIGLPFIWRTRTQLEWRHYAKLALPLALILTVMMLMMNWGLKYTTATKGVFITTLYVVFVPLIESAIRRKGFGVKVWACVLMALTGAALIADVGLGAVNQGDLLILVSSVLAAVQIYSFGLIGPRVKHAFVFFFYQCVWSALFFLPFVSLPSMFNKLGRAGSLSTHGVWHFWAIAAITTLGCTILAFSLQVRAQRHMSPTVASLVCLLEGPFAMFFAQVFLGEWLTPLEWVGAVLILAASVTAILFEARAQKDGQPEIAAGPLEVQ
jgi:drug/metabolite transporter (DMT)-like permease